MMDLWQRANEIIPGGNMLFSKTPDRYAPGQWPPYYKAARGINVGTPDGKTYQDFSVMGAGNSVLGYADPDVDRAVHEAIYDGNVSTLNCPEEVELAEVMLKLNPKMDMVRFGRSGNDACQIAVRIAREYKNEYINPVLICGYHGWQIGHPPQIAAGFVPVEYGEMGIFCEKAKEQLWPNIAAVMMEPVRTKQFDLTFVNKVRRITEENDIPLIFDEVASGFRCNLGGYHQLVGVQPDIVLYGKAMGNGYAISAVVGKDEIMRSALNTFISSMQWSERLGYVAGLSTIEKMRETDAQTKITDIGKTVKHIWRRSAAETGMGIEISGLDPLATFSFIDDQNREKITIFTQEMLKRGYLASGQFYASVCHTQTAIKGYADAVGEVLADIASGTAVLEGEPARAGFRRLA